MWIAKDITAPDITALKYKKRIGTQFAWLSLHSNKSREMLKE